MFFALLLVFTVDFFFVSRVAGPSENTLHVNVIESAANHRDAKRLRLAITPTGRFPADPITKQVELWDDMGKLLKELGDGFRYEEITEQQILVKEKKLRDYDVLFLTCAGGGEELNNDLLNFVSEGGIPYASDWRYDAVAAAFPTMANADLKGEGAKQELEADVVDPALREIIGKKIHIKFDLGQWKTAAFSGPRVKTLIQGQYVKTKEPGRPSSEVAVAPLMVKFTFGKGTVIFTSFHNEKQNSRTEKQLLQYLVFSLVTAGVDTEINAKMDQGGFTPQRSNLLSTPKRNQSISKTYENAKKADLRFALGFRNEGAKLRFNIKSPDGKEFTWEGASTVILDVPGAARGAWTYTVTDLVLPYENFPFTMTVGEKK